MKNLFFTILIIVLIVLFGTWPISILAKVFEYISIALNWLANALNIFGWNGIM
ncbi:MAG: hypothetical protein ACI4PF_06170 [Christensenellales bacterium]